MLEFTSSSEEVESHNIQNYDYDLAIALSRIDILPPKRIKEKVRERINEWILSFKV